MSSEGELKKLIRGEIVATSRRMDGVRCDSLTGMTKQPYESVTVYQKYFDFEKEDPFQKILDEATKEFPNKYEKWIDTGGGVDNGYYLEYYNLEEIGRWLKKWFGSKQI
jgi:hypothetical protein